MVLHSPGTLAAVLVRVAEVRAVAVVDSIETLDFTCEQRLIDARVAVGRRRTRRSGVVGRHSSRSRRRAGVPSSSEEQPAWNRTAAKVAHRIAADVIFIGQFTWNTQRPLVHGTPLQQSALLLHSWP